MSTRCQQYQGHESFRGMQRRTKTTQEIAPVRKYLVHCPHNKASRSSGPVGKTDAGWLAEDVEKLALQYCRPCEPGIANHQIRHEANNQVSRRRVASDARNRKSQNFEQTSQKIVLLMLRQSASRTPQRRPKLLAQQQRQDKR